MAMPTHPTSTSPPPQPQDEHTRRVAVVTGAGRERLGAAIVDWLAGANYCVVVHYRTAAEEAAARVAKLRAQGGDGLALGADLADANAVRQLFDAVLAACGRVDLLVNTAAVWKRRPLFDVTEEDLRTHYEVNTLGTFFCCQAAGRIMVSQPDGGCIINFGDWACVRPYRDYAAYFASKGAVEAMTRSFAVELGTRNPRVRVNAILPGPVLLPAETPLDERQRLREATLVQREGGAAAVVRAVAYLIENDFVTGETLRVDGGRSIYAPGEERL